MHSGRAVSATRGDQVYQAGRREGWDERRADGGQPQHGGRAPLLRGDEASGRTPPPAVNGSSIASARYRWRSHREGAQPPQLCVGREHHGRDLRVVRKGATPAFPGQHGFVGGSMGDDAVIVEGVDSPEAQDVALFDGAWRRPLNGPQGSQAPVHPGRNGCLALGARRATRRRGLGRESDGVPATFRRPGLPRSVHPGPPHLRPFAVAMAGKRVRSIQGLIRPERPMARVLVCRNATHRTADLWLGAKQRYQLCCFEQTRALNGSQAT